jgi:glycosyltransferase involved in cell wall biosynthesis
MVARELAARGHQVCVLAYSCVERNASDSEYPFELERIVLRGSRPLRLLRAMRRITARARQADVWYINGLLIEGGPVNWLLRKPAAAKVVGDIAWERARDKGWIADEFEQFQTRSYGWRIRLRRALRDAALRQTRAVITPSAYLKRIVTAWGIPAERVHVVYNAFDLEPASAAAPAQPLTTRHRLLTICRLTGWKGIDGLIEALASLPDVGLIVVGEGPEHDNLVGLTQRLGMVDRVFFAGQVDHAQVGAYLRACDLFVLNSRYEGLPHVVLEAMAAGLPIVATDVGGIGEVVQRGENGQLVQPGDTLGLRSAIVEVLADESLRARCLAARPRVMQRFSAAVMADATEQVLKAALQS